MCGRELARASAPKEASASSFAAGDRLEPAVEALLRGNKVSIYKAFNKASKADFKKIKKAVAAKRKAGEECYTDEELENAGFLAEY